MSSLAKQVVGWRGGLGGLVVFVAGVAGAFKGTSFFNWLPVDLTLLSVGLLSFFVAHHLLTRGVTGYLPWQVVALFAIFLPGVIQGVGYPGSSYKSAYLFTVTLMVVLAGTVLLSDTARRVGFIYAHVLGSGVMAVALIVAPNAAYVTEFGREAVEGASTISTSRVIFAGAVVLALVALTTAGGRCRLIAIVGAGALALSGVQVGSRGPVLAMGVAIAVVVLTTRALEGRRFVAYIGMTILGFAGMFLLLQATGGGASRVADVLSGTNVDPARISIYGEAARLILENPLGTGWGRFAETSSGGIIADHPHNLFLEVFLEGGWIAGASLLVFCVVGLNGLRRGGSGLAETCYYGLAIFWLAASLFSSDINGNRLALALIATGFVMNQANGGAESVASARVSRSQRSNGRSRAC